MFLKSDNRKVKIVTHDRAATTIDFLSGNVITEKYVYCLIPYTETEKKYAKPNTSHFHLQLVKKENLLEKPA